MKWILKGLKFLFTIGTFEEIKEVFASEKLIIQTYFGSSFLWLFYLAAMLFLFLKRKDLKNKLLIPLCILIFLFVFPQTFRFMRSYMFEGGSVYWRYMWSLQIHVIIAIALVEIVYLGRKANYGVALVGLGCLVIAGTFIFTPENFRKADNLYNIPDEVIKICNIIKEEVGEDGISDDLVVAPSETAGWMRMYDGDICLLYGRHSYSLHTHNTDTEVIDAYLTNGNGDLEQVLNKIVESNCSYVVLSKREGMDAIADWNEYVMLGETDNYVIYKISSN